MIGLNLLNVWHFIMEEIREIHNANSHVRYLRNNMDMIPCFKYIHIQNWFSLNVLLEVSTIVLYLLASGFFTVILLLRFLSQNRIWTNVALIIIKPKEWMVTKEYWKKLGFSPKIIMKESFRSKNFQHVFDHIKMIFK